MLIGKTRGLFPRYVCLPGMEHVSLSAMTGAGKGVSYVIPNCFNYNGSLVVLDIKGENFKLTSGYRQSIGNAIYRFSPLSADGCSHHWNPFDGITKDTPDYISKLQRRAYDLFPEISDTKIQFWQNRGRSAFFGISVLVAETPSLTLNPGTIFGLFIGGLEKVTTLIAESRRTKKFYSQNCINLIKDYLECSDEVYFGTRDHITSTMSLWFNPRIAAVTSYSDFNLADLRRKNITIYISIMPSDISRLGIMLRLFFLNLFEANNDALPEQDPTITQRFHILYDEFVTIPVMESIVKAAGFMRGFGMHSSYIVQSRAQISEAYRGKGEASLKDNLGVEIVFGANDHQNCVEASERSGFNTVNSVTTSGPRFMRFFRTREHNLSVHPHKRALLLPQEIARMKRWQLLMFRGSIPPSLLNKICWYKDRNFNKLVMSPPAIPPVRYTVAFDDGSISLAAPGTTKRKAIT